MAKRRFSDEERYAVYAVHGERCYMCREPIDLMTMEVDHVIPESLLDEPAKLNAIVSGYGLPADFGIQSFANWMPACGPCNGRKRERVFDPTPRIQLELQIAREKADQAAALAASRVSAQTAARAWNTIKRAHAAGTLATAISEAIREFVAYHEPHRAPEADRSPIRLTPLIEVISEANGIRLVRGPYGVGGGPMGPDIHSSFRCPTCGSVAWNGGRCVVCGETSDD